MVEGVSLLCALEDHFTSAMWLCCVAGIVPGEPLPLQPREMTTCEIYPSALQHSPNGRSATGRGGGVRQLRRGLNTETKIRYDHHSADLCVRGRGWSVGHSKTGSRAMSRSASLAHLSLMLLPFRPASWP